MEEFELRKEREPCTYSGKTARRKGQRLCSRWDPSQTDSVVIVKREIVKSEGLSFVPITEIDELLDRFDVNGQLFASLSKRNLWDEVESALQEKATSGWRGQLRFCRQDHIAFDIPVIDHVVMDSAEMTSRRRSTAQRPCFLTWEGRSYDPEKLWFISTEKKGFAMIKEFGPRSIDPPSFPDPAIIKINARLLTTNHHDASGHKLNHQHLNLRLCGDSCYQNSSGSETSNPGGIHLDFRRPHYLTHIGIAGETPRVRIFPPRDKRGGRRDHAPCSSPFIYLVDDVLDAAWVVAFELSYRSLETGKWIRLGTFQGSRDCLSEHVVSLQDHFNCKDGLLARHLRLVPTEHHVRPGFRVAVYGMSRTVQRRRQEEQETVRYALVQPRAQCWLHDGRRWRYDLWDDELDSGQKRRALRAAARQEAAGAAPPAAGSDDHGDSDDSDDGGTGSQSRFSPCPPAGGLVARGRVVLTLEELIDLAAARPGVVGAGRGKRMWPVLMLRGGGEGDLNFRDSDSASSLLARPGERRLLAMAGSDPSRHEPRSGWQVRGAAVTGSAAPQAPAVRVALALAVSGDSQADSDDAGLGEWLLCDVVSPAGSRGLSCLSSAAAGEQSESPGNLKCEGRQQSDGSAGDGRWADDACSEGSSWAHCSETPGGCPSPISIRSESSASAPVQVQVVPMLTAVDDSDSDAPSHLWQAVGDGATRGAHPSESESNAESESDSESAVLVLPAAALASGDADSEYGIRSAST